MLWSRERWQLWLAVLEIYPAMGLHFESNQSVVQQKMQIIKNETHHANKTGNVDNYGTIIEEESLADLLPMN